MGVWIHRIGCLCPNIAAICIIFSLKLFRFRWCLPQDTRLRFKHCQIYRLVSWPILTCRWRSDMGSGSEWTINDLLTRQLLQWAVTSSSQFCYPEPNSIYLYVSGILGFLMRNGMYLKWLDNKHQPKLLVSGLFITFYKGKYSMVKFNTMQW